MKIVIFAGLICLVLSLTGENICRENNKTFCCIGYKEENNICVRQGLECPPGFRGPECKPCPDNFFGKDCFHICNCKEREFCHPACGCLFKSQIVYNDSGGHNVTEEVTGGCFLGTMTTLTATKEEADRKRVLNFTPILQIIAPCACVFLVLIAFGAFIIYQFDKYKEKQEKRVKSIHNALYVPEEENRGDSTVNKNETFEDSIYDSASPHQACYSTLTLRVNHGSINNGNHEKLSVPFTKDYNRYDFDYDDGRNDMQDTVVSSFHLHKATSENHDVSSAQRHYEDV